jgi:Holliday junction resolvasome RuvABC endonuclease subunit
MGLDLALNFTGVAILNETGQVQFVKTLNNGLKREKGDPPITQSEVIQRLIDVANEIVGLAKDYKVHHVGIENYAYGAKYQAHQIGEVAGLVKVQLALACGIIPEVVPPSTARKHVMGYGGAGVSKDDIKHVVREGLGVEIETDHEADAVVVGRYRFDMAVARQKEMEKLL